MYFGYNAADDTYGDLIALGVVDPTKVTRVALQNAAGIASLILTSEAAIFTLPTEANANPMAGMGGMGGMM